LLPLMRGKFEERGIPQNIIALATLSALPSFDHPSCRCL